MKQNYSYPQEMLDKAKLMFTVNFKDDYTKPGIHQDLFNLLILQCQQDMTVRDFSITVLKFLKGQKYPDWKIADFYEYYEPSNKKPQSVLFKDTEQGRQLYLNDNKPEPKKLEQDEMSLLILKNIDLSNKIDELKSENNKLHSSIKSLQQEINFILKNPVKTEISVESEPIYEPEQVPPPLIGKPVQCISVVADEIYKQVVK